MLDISKIDVFSVVSKFFGTITSSKIEKRKMEFYSQEQLLKVKREKLDNIYKNLIPIISSFPKETPNDVLERNNCPVYMRENFDCVINSLDIQINDYAKRLESNNYRYEQKCEIESEISNRKFYKERIIKIKWEYYFAKGKYKKLFSNAKGTFEMYAGQSVKNSLVAFETTLHNAFVSGGCLWDGNMKINAMDNVRNELIRQIRQDIGTDL